LFLAHRQEIVKQAYEVSGSSRSPSDFGWYTGEQRDHGTNIYFATVQTLSRDEHLDRFPRSYFDYLILDEFHHAAADSYRRVLEHFQPRFLLGLTATPFRMDNQDIFALCDNNIIYEISLHQSIERDLLVPFNHYAVYNPTDYSEVKVANGLHVIDDLERQLSKLERADLILKHCHRLAEERPLRSCVSIKHAQYMADYFSKHRVAALAVHSQQPNNGRNAAIAALKEGRIKVIFAVDMFNEGVDILSLDTVMFLRPTESYVVFLQQLGRCLRKNPGKTHLTVVDFIDNYKRAYYVPRLLAGENPWVDEPRPGRPRDYDYPEGCLIKL
jgi:superfamily II DNA or RNA helicase